MPRLTLRARPFLARALFSGACIATAALLAACGSDNKPTTPIVPGSPPPGPMITLTGEPRVACDVQVFVNRAVGVDTLSGYFSAILNDSTGRVFVGPASLDTTPMRFETDPLGRPFRYVLRPVELAAGYAASDSLHLSVHDTTATTPDFRIDIAPSTLDLPRDSTVLSQKQDLVLRWKGRAEQVRVKLTDQFGKNVSAILQFENETGVSELLIRAQDLAGLAPGPISVGAVVTNSELLRAPPLGKPISVTMNVTDGRKWTLSP